jgi:hypothetical protein
MTREEMTQLTEFIAIACPQQKINRATAVAWFEIIGDLDFGAARNAVIAVKHSQAFVDPSDIIREVEHSSRRHAHPSERTVAEALGQPAVPAIGAARTDPTPEYLAAKADMDRRQRERDQSLYLASREAQRRAQDWINYKLGGRFPAQAEFTGEPAPQWRQLPGDPPELRAWLARQAMQEASG